ncbi:MAG: ribonuclease J, partial [Vicinamibacteria bacterium]
AAAETGRRVLVTGLSMVSNCRVARDLGYLRIPPEIELELSDLDRMTPREVVVLTTGSQGEPLSALMRMAMEEHREITLHEGDTVILSSKFIPGNERAIGSMINHLYRRGAEVIYESILPIHASGHAYRDELRMMLRAVRPEFFIPIHGEYRHLIRHARLAEEEGVAAGKCLVGEDGDVFLFHDEGGAIVDRIESGRIFVDGKGVGDVEEFILRDRQQLGEDGILVVSVVINRQTGQIISGPDLITRGFLGGSEGATLLEEARALVTRTLESTNVEAKTDRVEASELVRVALRRFFKKRIERRPIIVPILVEM